MLVLKPSWASVSPCTIGMITAPAVFLGLSVELMDRKVIGELKELGTHGGNYDCCRLQEGGLLGAVTVTKVAKT